MKKIAACISLLLSILFITPLWANDAPADLYKLDRFSVVTTKIADDVYVIMRPVSHRWPVQTNVIVIVNEKDVVVVDGGGLPPHAENVISEIKRLTSKPVSVIVNTHWHQDHNWGHAAYRRHYPEVRVISHEETRKALLSNNFLKNLQDQDLQTRIDESLVRFKEGLVEEEENGEPAESLARTRDIIAGVPQVYAAQNEATDGLADETFLDKVSLYRGERRIDVMFLGRANTNGDVVVWLPEEKIIATGDIVVRPTPYGFGSHPKEWVEVLNHIKALDYVALVPGHGEVQTDTAYLDLLIELLNAVVERTKAAVDAGAADMDVVREAVDLSDFDERFTGGDPLLEALFNSWFKRPIVGGAYQDLTEAE